MDIHSRCSTPVPVENNFQGDVESYSPEQVSKRGVEQAASSKLFDENSPSKVRKIGEVSDFFSGASSHRLPLQNITNSPEKNPLDLIASTKKSVLVRPQPLKLFPDENTVEKSIFNSEQLAELQVEQIDRATAEDPNALLLRYGFEMTPKPLGSGKFGAVYDLTHQSNSNQLVYKIQTSPKTMEQDALGIWRSSDFATAELREEIPHLIKIHSYMVAITMPEGGVQHFYVPLNQVKEFFQKIPPHAQVQIKGMLMAKAPGKNLAQLFEEGVISANLADLHFCRIVVGMHEFATGAYEHNFIHGDIKPANIMYDFESGKVTIVDTGESLLLHPRNQEGDASISSSQGLVPTTTKKTRGTRHFMAPAVTLGRSYGSEVDFFSIGMTLLSLINKKDVHSVTQKRFSTFGQWDKLFEGKEATDFLSTYLAALDSKSDSTNSTLTCLRNQPLIREIIECDFLISGGGPEGEVALANLHAIISGLKGV